MKSLLVLVNANNERAKEFYPYFSKKYYTKIIYRRKNKIVDIFRFIYGIIYFNPHIVYIIDIGVVTTISLFFAKLINKIIILDTGDAVYELSKNIGKNFLFLIKLGENLSLRLSNFIVVRGTFHKEYLNKLGYKNVFVIPDGVNTEKINEKNVSDLRQKFMLNDYLTIGVIGSINWSKKLNWCYGLEIIEVLKLLRNEKIKGIIIGIGDGLQRLKFFAKNYEINNKILFLPTVSEDDLSKYISLIDICISTQTNDICGNVRTTGKLPLYLACNRYILATEVGEAKLFLPKNMLIPYDKNYYERLATKIKYILEHKEELEKRKKFSEIAINFFDYKILGEKLVKLLDEANRKIIAK